MKLLFGLIVLIIKVSISFSLRELDFMEALYPGQNIPKPIFMALVNRRMVLIKDLPVWTKRGILDLQTFYEATNQSLSLIVDLLNADDKYLDNETVTFYQQTVEMIPIVQDIAIIEKKSTPFEPKNIDAHSVYRRHSGYYKDELVELIDFYINDIKIVIDYQKSIGDLKRVDMKIVDALNELFKAVKASDVTPPYEGMTPILIVKGHKIGRKAMDQDTKRLEFLLDKFIAFFNRK